MEKIIKKYYLEEGSKLVKAEPKPKAVDCWFENNTVRQHRCLSHKDFQTIRQKK